MTLDQKLERFAERELTKHIGTAIIQNAQGGVLAFGRYYLSAGDQGMQVQDHAGELLAHFSNKKTALAWCVADRYNQLNLARRIKVLDAKRQLLANECAYNQHMQRRSVNGRFLDVLESKLSVTLSRLAGLDSELEKCINSAKYLQLKGFQNETARVFYH